jgi:hypothetical protein
MPYTVAQISLRPKALVDNAETPVRQELPKMHRNERPLLCFHSRCYFVPVVFIVESTF